MAGYFYLVFVHHFVINNDIIGDEIKRSYSFPKQKNLPKRKAVF